MSSDMNGFPTKGGLGFIAIERDESYTNRFVPSINLKAASPDTDLDLTLVPKGNGALQVNVPDGSITNGSKRGLQSVDLQISRNAAAQVASGATSFVVGQKNTASGTSGVAVGNGNTASNISTFTAGQANTSSGAQTGTIGFTNLASATTAMAFGSRNVASGISSIVTGESASAFSIYGRRVHAAGLQTTVGDAQSSQFVLRQITTDATTSTMTCGTDGQNVASSTNQVVLQNNNAIAFQGVIVAKQSASTNAAAWKIEGLIVRGTTAGSTTLVTSSVVAISNVPVWGTPALSADTTNGCLKVDITGLAGTNIRWTAKIDTSETIYA